MAPLERLTTVKILYLFPDTNVFLQCKPLEQVSWSAFGDWDQIEVLLTRPVQTEIDALKGKGNGRQASRARSASSRIRELLQTVGECLTLREQPLVRLCLRHDLRRNESASGDLNYEERDDQLVGTALGFQKSNRDAAVLLLTNDTGPMASAKAVGLKYREVPDEWFLPPEADDSEKRESALKAEIARYKSLEPSFAVKLLPTGERRIQASLTMFRPLSAPEFDELLARLRARYPLCRDFGPTEVQERMNDHYAASTFFSQAKEVFQPATPSEIDKYREAYSKWENECAERLSNLPSGLHKCLLWPKIIVQIENSGSRPADGTLVIFEIQGDVFLRPPRRHEDEEKEEDDCHQNLRLSQAPSAPKGEWKQIDPFSGIKSIADLVRTERAWMRDDLMRPILGNLPARRDPNGLYYKVGGRGLPSKHIEYECGQWRHAQSAKNFEFNVLCPLKPGTYLASVKVEVHAANLTHPEVAWLSMELSVAESSCLEAAEKMIATLGA